jgi:phosphate transport system substrate-binding protein
MNDLMAIWGGKFQRIYPSARVALDDFSWRDVRGGASTFGPLLSTRSKHKYLVKEFEENFGYAPAPIPVCFYAVALYVHKKNPCQEGLRIDQVEDIFSAESKYRMWGDLGYEGEWLKRPITLYAPKGPRSYRALFYLLDRFGPGFAFKDSVKLCLNDATVVSSVEKDPCGIGLAMAGCQTEEVRELPLAPSGSSKFIPPTAVKNCKGAYPLACSFCLLLNHDFITSGVELDPLRREFLRYILSRDGQQAVIEAGFIPLTAEMAERALAKAKLTPTGEGTWALALARLRARGLPHEQMRQIETVAERIGDRPAHEQLLDFSTLLASTALASSVTFETEVEGAVVRYRSIRQPGFAATFDPSKDAKATISIGLYHVWTERDGKATSPMEAWFQVTRENERIRICESRYWCRSVPGPGWEVAEGTRDEDE